MQLLNFETIIKSEKLVILPNYFINKKFKLQ